MFYSKSLMKSASVGQLWRSAHNVNCDTNGDCPGNLNITCAKLRNWVLSDAEVSHRRLSLRTSQTLVAGAARVYRRQLDLLLDDAITIDGVIVKRNRTHSASSIESTSSTFRITSGVVGSVGDDSVMSITESSPTDPTAPEVMQKVFRSPITTVNVRKRPSSMMSPDGLDDIRRFQSSDDYETPSKRRVSDVYDRDQEDDGGDASNDGHVSDDHIDVSPAQFEVDSPTLYKDASTQTSQSGIQGDPPVQDTRRYEDASTQTNNVDLGGVTLNFTCNNSEVFFSI